MRGSASSWRRAERQVRDSLQARLESGEPLQLPDPSDDEQQSVMLPAEAVAFISQLDIGHKALCPMSDGPRRTAGGGAAPL